MKTKRPATALLPTSYAPWLAALKARVRSAQLQAAARVNHELLRLYWDLGRAIADRQKQAGWGAGIIPRLAADLHAEFPDMAGFSERNFGRMVAFYREYPALFAILPQPAAILSEPGKVPQPAAQFDPVNRVALISPPPVAKLDLADPASPLLQPLAEKLPWAHHVILMEKVKDRDARAWYMQAAVEHGWSRSMLAVQIAQRAHRRTGKAVTNFATTLPPPQSDLAQQTLRDPYVFDFLTLSSAARERELEQGLIDHVQQFLVSLGAGFAFVGRQVHLEVGGEDYYLDLLFYHLKLRCFVVIDLKTREFTPEAAGKMNFYLSAVDAQLRHRDDQPSLGLLLCREKNRLTVEYALRDVKKPIGVAEWRTRLVASLPKKLRSSLPTVAQIEASLGRSPAPSR
ncbi:MAG TPA: PDDEXK nuclease domain-containing protein [Opitutaceae bacterium]|nr:PDDEXK nuclease domain-containing protein [Opitutaceae bacterium]HPG16899.1 PDDEXK nuclease domain-containing protein [Opitutaceae bacterium]